MRRAAAAIAITFGALSPATADPPKIPPRPAHYGLGIGGYAAVTGPAGTGAAAVADIYPGGSFGRFGARVEARWFDALSDGYATFGVAYEAGAARPLLVMSLHAEVGAAFSNVRPVVGGGLHIQLLALGPVGIGIDSTTTLLIDGIDSSLILGTAATLRLAK